MSCLYYVRYRDFPPRIKMELINDATYCMPRYRQGSSRPSRKTVSRGRAQSPMNNHPLIASAANLKSRLRFFQRRQFRTFVIFGSPFRQKWFAARRAKADGTSKTSDAGTRPISTTSAIIASSSSAWRGRSCISMPSSRRSGDWSNHRVQP